MNCDVGKATEGLENELWRTWSDGKVGEWALLYIPISINLYLWTLLILQPFFVTSTTSQLILQPFRRFTYVTVNSLTLSLLHIRHSSFFNPSFASPTSQALHLIHLANRPCLPHWCPWVNLKNETGKMRFWSQNTLWFNVIVDTTNSLRLPIHCYKYLISSVKEEYNHCHWHRYQLKSDLPLIL